MTRQKLSWRGTAKICGFVMSPTAPSFPPCRKRWGRKGALWAVTEILQQKRWSPCTGQLPTHGLHFLLSLCLCLFQSRQRCSIANKDPGKARGSHFQHTARGIGLKTNQRRSRWLERKKRAQRIRDVVCGGLFCQPASSAPLEARKAVISAVGQFFAGSPAAALPPGGHT